ncbi:hypothetical protein COV18_00025 [Candidatus Woesearchaeota archaeon CG10_big_fil_rev_8_21_14_0_10_37_12]|nr:MAG: hypothetical protein COV18_00025 [Candidatus Woesearchaeota archaeon CG10_big_fil_rev_8_21_14_0_10_37_12]
MSFCQHKGMALAGFKIAIRYRWENIAQVLTNPISLIVYYFLWKAIYAYTGQEIIRGFTFPDLVHYYVLAMIVGFFTWSEVDKWIEYDVIHGKMTNALIRPFGFLYWYLSFETGISIYNLIVQTIPVFIIGFIFFNLQVQGLTVFLGFFASTTLAFFIYFGLAFLLGLAAFWMKRITGLRRVRRIIIGFLGGSFIPLTFFPNWLQQISHFLPFEYVRSVPILVYLERISIFNALATQLIWMIIIYLLIHIISKKAIKRYASVGL